MKINGLTKKLMIIGIDGMDPRLTKKYIEMGIMPNTKKIVELGASREDLILLGAQPPVTPPQWTTLSTGAYPMTHGITGFFRQSKEDLDVMEYNLDSRLCTAEQAWNGIAEAGYKTMVWHWPGSSWPPTSDNPNLSVVDGTSPGSVGMGTSTIESEFILRADEKFEELILVPKAASSASAPCVIDDVPIEKNS